MKYSNEIIHNYVPRILSQVLLFCCILFVMAKQSRPWVTFLFLLRCFIMYSLPEGTHACVCITGAKENVCS